MNTVLQSDYTTLALKSNHMYSSPLYKICCFSVAKKNETIHFPPACIKGHTSSCLFAACQTWRPSKPFGSLNSSLEKLFKNSSFMWKDYSGISETYRLCKCQLNCKASGGGGGWGHFIRSSDSASMSCRRTGNRDSATAPECLSGENPGM